MHGAATDELTRVEGSSVPNGEPAGGSPNISVLEGRWLVAAGVGVSAVLAVGIVLRFWTRSELWLDEALTVNIASLPLHDLSAALKRDGAPPLYYALLHFWMKAFGTSNLGARSLSAALSIATLPVAWVAGRRYGGRSAAWVVLILVASAPFAIYYGTEARMYSLVILLSAGGFVALDRALERPRPGNLVAVALVTAGLLYSQYWALYLIGVIGLRLLWLSWRGLEQTRANARRTLLAVVVGCLAFVPWLPTFVYQSQHTGTPWAAPANFSAIISAVTGFADNQATLSAVGSNQGRLLALLYFLFAFLALFGLGRDRVHIELDIRTRPFARGMAVVVVGTLVVAVAGGILTRSAFSPRYAAVVFVPLLLLVALGTLTVLDARVRAWLIAVAAVAGLALSVENVYTQRTQAGAVTQTLAAQAQPGDIVAFCPDQLGPAVFRLVPPGRYTMVTFPRGTGPAFVNWVDYTEHIKSVDPGAFARGLEDRAGHGHRIWVVWAPAYQGYKMKCETLVGDLLGAPGYGGHTWVDATATKYYEPMGLTEFAPPSAPTPTGASTR
jgi:mannosyltransferase